MNSWMIHPRYFSAYAAAAGAVASDPDLPKGMHLRLFPCAALGFPLAPFLLWPVDAFASDLPPMAWISRDHRSFATPDLDAAGGELIGWRQDDVPSDGRIVGIEARFRGAGELALLHRIDDQGLTARFGRDDRVVAARSAVRWLVAAPQISRMRLRGQGQVSLQSWVISGGRAIEALLGQLPFAALSLPITGERAWYSGGEGSDVGLRRVQEGAPQRWGRPDRPDGPFDSLGPDAELARIRAAQADIDDEIERLLGDADVVPGAVERTHLWLAEVMASGKKRAWQRATERVQESLLMKALDPGAAHYLGLAANLADLLVPTNPFQPPGARGWLAAGLFATGPAMRFELPDPDAQEQRLIERLMELQPGVRDPAALAIQRHGLTLRAFVATALAAPPPDLLAAPQLTLGDSGWQRADDSSSVLFRQQLRIFAPPLTTLIAVGRLESAVWKSRHETVDLTIATPGADPSERAAPRMIGSTGSLADGRYGIVSDQDIPAEGAPWTYRVALSDVFGRFGAPSDITVPTPPRPDIPQPVVQSHLTLADRAEGDDPVVAGSIRLSVVVPAWMDMAAGSRPLSRALALFDGAAQDAATSDAGGLLHFDFPLPALLPLESRILNGSATFEDADGHISPAAELQVVIRDPRAPPVPRTGIGIVWSSRPAPAIDVELRLMFTGMPGARYRAYMADARGLEIALIDGDRLRSRAEIAVDGAQRGLAGLGMRDRFRLLTDPPLICAADGNVAFDTRLPRSLETVQFLRFVPLSEHGSEAAFESCPLLPIAVPSDRRPPAPQVEVTVDPLTSIASVTIRAIGLDLVALRAAEPGLFDAPPAADASRPEFRLRRASGGVPDALYAREIGRGPLERVADDFAATIEDAPTPSGMSAYVRYAYWAEIRHPAERRLPRGVAEVALPAGAVEPTQAAQREDAPAAFSRLSAPATAIFVPAIVPTLAESQVTATVGAGAAAGTWRLTLAIAGGQTVSSKAVGSFGVRLHLQLDGGDWIPEGGESALVDGRLTLILERAAPAVPMVGVALVLIDPIGREAKPLLLVADAL